MEKNKSYKIFLGIYKISQECEIALDGYEEFPNIYKKTHSKMGLFITQSYKYNYENTL